MSAATRDEFYFDPWDPNVTPNPYPHYPRLRDRPGLCFLGERDCWLVSRYDDVRTVLMSPQIFSSAPHGLWTVTGPRPEGAAPQGRESLTLISSDPPAHDRFRRMVAPEFTPKAIARWEQRVRAIASQLFDEMAEKNEAGEADFMRDFATPLPVMVIAEMLGIPAADRAEFKQWTEESLGFASLMPGMKDKALEADRKMREYFEAMVEEKSAAPGDDLIGLLIRAGQRDEQPLTAREIIGHCQLFLVGGNETTTNLIGNTLCAFEAYPDQAARILQDPNRIPPALEETLRYDGSSIAMFRTVDEPTTLAGTPLPVGAHVMLLYGSANHDERRWGDDSEAYRAERNPKAHFGFGGGIHHCLGAPLARLEARTAIETFLARTDGFQFRGEPLLNQHVLVRGRWEIPIHFERRAVARWT